MAIFRRSSKSSERLLPLPPKSRREYGFKGRHGENARLQNSLATATKVHLTWDPKSTIDHTDHGGVFNFDFSKDGSILGVACERKSVLLFDPYSGKLIGHKNNAHTDCVNCVKFLDSRLFATCSDDTTVALWDLRYLKHNIHTFRGHANWVKNIEYAPEQGLLLTSGFDGCIYTWNINSYSDEESSKRIFYTSGLMRSKLSPDSSKLLISTHEGYIIVIHNLDLTTLADDLKGFKPNMYRLMQRSQTPLRLGLMYNHVFEQEKNRVEFLADWPTGNDANIISSLQVHPQGWCAISRNTDTSENAEWTCVHDIQDYGWKSQDQKSSGDMSGVTPNTSSSYCSSTYTPAFSSVAPSDQRNAQTSSRESDGARSSTSTSEGNEADPNEVPQAASRPGSDSLIQIRRGARTGDGQFSFSISVHTATGRTIEFNNTDFDESDEDVHVDPSTGVISVTSSGGRSRSRNIDLNDSSDEDSDDEYANVAERLMPYDHNSSDSSSSETYDFTERQESEQQNTETSAASSRTSPTSRISQDNVTYIAPLTDSPPAISQTVSSDNNTVSQSTSESSSGRAQSTTAGQPRNNTFMFVLQSNAGRRILNLRYMDSYSERENSMLQKKIFSNTKRLVAYAEECNVGRGFIKEVGFSADGRLICSPFGFGLRLFGFDSSCNELCDCVPSSPVKLYEVTCSLAHVNCVVATKFSPTQNLVVSGCLDGKIAFHQPVL